MNMKEFMNKVWTATEIENVGLVVDRRVCYGALPDIQFTVEKFDGTGLEFISAKEMFDCGVGFKGV
jgi:hypothetical protein